MYLTVSANFSLKQHKGEKNEPGIRSMQVSFNKKGDVSPIIVLGAIAFRVLDLIDSTDTPVEELQDDLAKFKAMVASIEIKQREAPKELMDIANT